MDSQYEQTWYSLNAGKPLLVEPEVHHEFVERTGTSIDDFMEGMQKEVLGITPEKLGQRVEEFGFRVEKVNPSEGRSYFKLVYAGIVEVPMSQTPEGIRLERKLNGLHPTKPENPVGSHEYEHRISG